MSSLEDINIDDQDDDEDNQNQGVDTSQGFEDGDVNINLDSTSFHQNIVDPFALLQLRDNVEKVNSKVKTVSSKTISLDSMLDLGIKPLSEIKVVAPSKIDKSNQLDQLIFHHLSRTLEEAEEHYKSNIDHHISTRNMMLKIHDDMISATDKLIKQTHVHHERQIQTFEEEIK